MESYHPHLNITFEYKMQSVVGQEELFLRACLQCIYIVNMGKKDI
jgi:hypothetical protein